MKQEVDSLTIKVAGKDDDFISADSFLSIVRESIGILRSLDAEKTLIWKLKSASISSPLSMTFVAEPRKGVETWATGTGRRYVELFRNLDEGKAREAVAPEKAKVRAGKLIDVLNNGVAQVTFLSPGVQPVTPTQRVQATVSEITQSKRDTYSDFGTIEGELRTVTVQGGSAFIVFDELMGWQIRCVIPHDRLEEAKAAMERRVSVSGFIKYKNGKPDLIEVDPKGFEIFPKKDELPGFDDIRGIDPTGGEDSVTFVRRGMDGW